MVEKEKSKEKKIDMNSVPPPLRGLNARRLGNRGSAGGREIRDPKCVEKQVRGFFFLWHAF